MKITKKDYIALTTISIIVFLSIFYTNYIVGVVRDEGFYMKAAKIMSNWFIHTEKSFLNGDFLTPFSDASISRYFSYNHEHPALMKMFFGFSYYIFTEKLHLMGIINSTRMVAAIFSALIAIMIYLFSLKFFNRKTAVYSPFFFLFMPRIFFHSHLACFDMPVLFFWSGLFVVYVFYLQNPTKKMAIFTALFFGIAMDIKHNAFFAPFIFAGIWFFFYFIFYKKQPQQNKGIKGFFKSIPLVFWLFPTLSLLVYYIFWPWLWHHPVDRFMEYFRFHLHHVNYTNYYFGKELSKGPFPFSFPWAMTFFTTPIVQLVLFFASIYYMILKIFSKNSLLEKQIFSILLSGALFPIFLIALPTVPIFGGIKHWFTGYPLLIAPGLFFIIQGLNSIIKLNNQKKKQIAVVFILSITLLFTVPANIKFSRRGPAFFNLLIGGNQGAAQFEMQRNFWGYDVLDLIPELNLTAPKNATIFIAGGFEGLNWNSFQFLKEEGLVRKDIRATDNLKNADFAFFFYEKQNESLIYSIYNEFKTAKPIAVTQVNSVLYSALFRRVK